MEAFFLFRLHEDYKANLIDADCPNPLIFAQLLVSELLLIAPPWASLDNAALAAAAAVLADGGGTDAFAAAADAWAAAVSAEGRQQFSTGIVMAKGASPFQQHLMVAAPAAWPLRKAMAQVQRTMEAADSVAPGAVLRSLRRPRRGTRSSCQPHSVLALTRFLPPEERVDGLQKGPDVVLQKACWEMEESRGEAALLIESLESAEQRRQVIRQVDFVIAHCRESLEWLSAKLKRVPAGAALFVYEKCGGKLQPEELAAVAGKSKFQSITVVQRPDEGSTRGDECSAYLTHIVGHHTDLADFTVFLQSDPYDHLHFDFLDLVLRSIAAGTHTQPFLALNGPRHVRTLTPCLQSVHEEIFGTNLTELLGPYCCAQFVVSRDAIRAHSLDFYGQMLSLTDGSRSVDLCGIEGTKRSTQCYGFEFLWHVVFGQEVDPPSREEPAVSLLVSLFLSLLLVLLLLLFVCLFVS
ncbi:unnamed protein product [Polarella glacialis]|uniref:Uncharacterized protein n=2 Tax=Polarella glacialis TaxID=89957 RepID=A0A813FKY8_POLGL|nr:unnamed protein product [Polarella glacialis]